MFGRKKGRVRVTNAGILFEGDADFKIVDERHYEMNNVDVHDERSAQPSYIGTVIINGVIWYITGYDNFKDTYTLKSNEGQRRDMSRAELDYRMRDYYPTAEQARSIEPEIRHDLVDQIIQHTLSKVARNAKQGYHVARIVYPSDGVNLAEKELVESKLSSLGYENSSSDCPVPLVIWKKN